MFAKLISLVALTSMFLCVSGCTPPASDAWALPASSIDSTVLVGDYLSVSKAQEIVAFDVCDPRMMAGYRTASPLARSIADDVIWDLSDGNAALPLLDSLFSTTSQRFYMTVVERTMERADGYYAEALGVVTKRFFEVNTCDLAKCCWENGCGDERSVHKWANSIASEFLIGSEDDPLVAFQLWSREIRSGANEKCDQADRQRTDEILLAIKESLVRSLNSASP
jgi:hypothetical protein